jgi:hypothetical protein
LRKTFERIARRPVKGPGRRQDLQGMAVALFVASALNAEGSSPFSCVEAI